MKKIILTAAIAISALTIQSASAQISLNINLGSQPAWGPVGYNHVDYYYLPDIDAYYDVPAKQYVVYENNVWVHRSALPSRYRGYDPYKSYKVVVNERTPWVRNTVIREKYSGYRGRHDQVIIRDRRPEVRTVKYVEKHDNGKHKGWDKKDKGRGHDKGGKHRD